MIDRLRALPRAVKAIWAVGLGGLLFRWWLVLVYRPTCDTGAADCYTLGGDAFYHHGQANLIADGEWFKNPAELALSGTLVDSAGDPPLYVLFLATFSKLGMDSVTWHRGASTLCGFALIVICGLLARRVATDVFGEEIGDRAGVVAAVVAAIHPLMWINDIILLSESIYQPLIALTAAAGYAWTRDPSRRWIALTGAAAGVASLARPEALSLLGFLVVILVVWRNPLTTAERVRQGAIGVVAGLVVVAPWIIYNNLRFDEPVTMTAVTGTVMMSGSCDTAWSGESMGIWAKCFEERGLQVEMEEELPGSYRAADDPERVVYDESVRDRFNTEKALEYTFDNIERYPLVALARMGRSLELFRVQHTYRVNWAVEGRWQMPSLLGLIGYYALVPFTLLGFEMLRRRGARLVPFAAMWPMVLLASAMTFGLTRYRVPIDIAMIVVSSFALAWLWPHVRAGVQSAILDRT